MPKTGFQTTPADYSRTKPTITVADINIIAEATSGVDSNRNNNGHIRPNNKLVDTLNVNQQDIT